MTPVIARLKTSVRFPPLRGMYQNGGTCKGCDIEGDERADGQVSTRVSEDDWKDTSEYD